jgi:CheY-like chemotaxis protein
LGGFTEIKMASKGQDSEARPGNAPGDHTELLKGYRVLLIDDEPEMMDLIRLILERERGDEIICAVGGCKGIAEAQGISPDLIILDIMMPDLDGWETYTHIKAIPALQKTPILFIAAASAEYIYPRAKQIGAKGYLQEPFGPSNLVTARDTLLSGETYYPPVPEGAILGKRRAGLLQWIANLFCGRG